MNPTATMSDDFDAKYKKASSRLKKLWKLRGSLSVDARINIYEMMILPLLIYAFTLHLKLTDTQVSKLCSIERRAKDIIKSRTYKTKSIENIMKKQACILVKKCLSKNVCENFFDYFTLNMHRKNTRNNGLLLKLPHVRLEFERKAFYFQGATLFNSLPKPIREIDDFNEFKCALNLYFN